jgi:hypothetical protein
MISKTLRDPSGGELRRTRCDGYPGVEPPVGPESRSCGLSIAFFSTQPRSYAMRMFFSLAVIAGVMLAASPAFARKCHMEKQCKWKDYKKVCVMVKVCR